MANVLNMQGESFEAADEQKASKVSIIVCHKSKKSYFACFVK